jgi:hypothetical protein
MSAVPNDTMGGQSKTALMKPVGVKQGHPSGLGRTTGCRGSISDHTAEGFSKNSQSRLPLALPRVLQPRE